LAGRENLEVGKTQFATACVGEIVGDDHGGGPCCQLEAIVLSNAHLYELLYGVRESQVENNE